MSRLGELTGMVGPNGKIDRRNVNAALRKLEKTGYLTRNLQRRGGGFGTTIYAIRFADETACGDTLPDCASGNDMRPGDSVPRHAATACGDTLPDSVSGNALTTHSLNNPLNVPIDSSSPKQLELVAEKPARHDVIGEAFEEFWTQYPKHVAKEHAKKAYKRALQHGKTTISELLNAAMRYSAECIGKDRQYIAHAATWLNGRRWLDEPTPGLRINGSGRKPTTSDVIANLLSDDGDEEATL